MIIIQRFLLYFVAHMAALGLHGQSDTLSLNNGRILVGSYKVSYTFREVESKTNRNEVYLAKDVKSLSTAKNRYCAITIYAQSETSYYMAERLLDSEVDMYGVHFPLGYFNTNSVAQSFFFFEKDGVLSYVNKANLEGFYSTYFGNCYGSIADKSLLYNEVNITYMLNAYNHCLNPSSSLKEITPAYNDVGFMVFGGFGNLKHYPLNVAFNDGRFEDKATHLGFGLNLSLLKRKIIIGMEINQARHKMTSPVFVAKNISYAPIIMNADFHTIALNLTASYNFKLSKLALQPGVSIGFGKLYAFNEDQIQPEIYINYIPKPVEYGLENIFSFDELYYNLNAFAKVSFDLTNRISVFTRAGFDISLTKSVVGNSRFLVVPVEGNYAFDGMVFTAGAFYKFKS
jgi:hypothetical protein